MAGDGGCELFDQHAQFVDLAGHGLDAVRACGICRHHAALDGGQPAPEFGDLAREVGGAARQIRDLAPDVGAIAQPHRDRVVEDQEGQRGERDDRRFRSADTGHRIPDQAERRCDQHHADSDENRGNADHVARNALKPLVPWLPRSAKSRSHESASPSTASLALLLIRGASVLSARPEPPVGKLRLRFSGAGAAEFRPLPATAGRGKQAGGYATARITLATFSTISPIWSSLTIKGGVSASVSPATRSIRSLSWNALFRPSKPRLPGRSGRGARSMPAVKPTVRMSTTFGSLFSDITAP